MARRTGYNLAPWPAPTWMAMRLCGCGADRHLRRRLGQLSKPAQPGKTPSSTIECRRGTKEFYDGCGGVVILVASGKAALRKHGKVFPWHVAGKWRPWQQIQGM